MFRQAAILTVHQRREAMQRLSDCVSQADLARSYGVLQATISWLTSRSLSKRAPRFPQTEAPAPMTCRNQMRAGYPLGHCGVGPGAPRTRGWTNKKPSQKRRGLKVGGLARNRSAA